MKTPFLPQRNSTRRPWRLMMVAWLALMVHGIPAFAQDGGYMVRGVEVSATASDATTARMNALSKAEADAFARLLERYLPADAAQARAAATPAHQIGRMVRGYEVQNERISGTSYAATLDVAFDPAQVQAFLNPPAALPEGTPPAHAIPPSVAATAVADVTRGNILLLPVMRAGERPLLWEENNIWRQSWNAADRSHVPYVRLPIGDQSDRMTMEAQQALTAPYRSFGPITERYQAAQVVVAQAYPAVNAGVQALGVTLRRLDSHGMAEARQLVFEREGGENQEQLMQRAVAEVIAILAREGGPAQGQHPAAASASTQPSAVQAPRARLTVLSRLHRLGDWVTLRKRLLALPNVAQVDMSAISNQQVDMVVHYHGHPDELEAHMRNAGLKVGKGPNYWIVGM